MLCLNATAATAARHSARCGSSGGNRATAAAAAASPALAARGRARAASQRAVAASASSGKSGPSDPPSPSPPSAPPASRRFRASFSFDDCNEDGAAALSASVTADLDRVVAFSRMLPALMGAQQQQPEQEGGGAGASGGAAATTAALAAATGAQAAAERAAAEAQAAAATSAASAVGAAAYFGGPVAALSMPPPGSTHVFYMGALYPLLPDDEGGRTVIYNPDPTDVRTMRPGLAGLRFLSLPRCDKTEERFQQLVRLGATEYSALSVKYLVSGVVWYAEAGRKHVVLNGEVWPVFPDDAKHSTKYYISVPPAPALSGFRSKGKAVRMHLDAMDSQIFPKTEYLKMFIS